MIKAGKPNSAPIFKDSNKHGIELYAQWILNYSPLHTEHSEARILGTKEEEMKRCLLTCRSLSESSILSFHA